MGVWGGDSLIKYNKTLEYIVGDTLDLKLIKYFEGNNIEIPYYWYEIILKSINKSIGKISIRIGHNYHSYYNGNIGYEIDEEYRGNNYSYIASKMVLDTAKIYGMSFVYLACNDDNIASYKIIEKLGSNLIESIIPPKDYFGYYYEIPLQRIYKLNL